MKSRSSASTVTSAFQYPVIGPVTRAAANLGPGPKAQSEMCGGAKSPPKIWPSFLSTCSKKKLDLYFEITISYIQALSYPYITIIVVKINYFM